MAVNTRPALPTREAVASFTAPAAVPVKLVRAAARGEGGHYYHYHYNYNYHYSLREKIRTGKGIGATF